MGRESPTPPGGRGEGMDQSLAPEEPPSAGQMRYELMASSANPWDEYAAEYSQFIARREQADLERDAILSRMLDLLARLRRCASSGAGTCRARARPERGLRNLVSCSTLRARPLAESASQCSSVIRGAPRRVGPRL